MTRVGRITSELRKTPSGTLRAVLGTLVWLLVVLLPRLYRGLFEGVLSVLVTLLPIALLVAGTLLAQRNRRAAEPVLLAAFPIAIALGLSGIEHDVALSTFSPWLMLIAAASLMAYEAVALDSASRRTRHREVDEKPLGEVAPVDPERRRQRLGSVVLGSVAAGAVAVLIWGSWETPAHYREHWGKAAASGALLTALLAGLVGVAALSLVAPGLRA